MPYAVGPGGGAGFDFLANFIAGRNAQMQQSKQNAMQEQDMQMRMAQFRAQQAQEQARMQLEQQQLKNDQINTTINQREHGIDPTTGKPFQYGALGAEATSPKSSLSHREAIARTLQQQALANGDMRAAAQYGSMANNYATEDKTAKDESLKFQSLAEKVLQDAAQRAHMQNQDAASAAHVQIALMNAQTTAARLAEDIAHHRITEGQAQDRLAISLKQLGLSAGRFGMEKTRLALSEKSNAKAMNEAPTQAVDAATNESKKMGIDPATWSAALQDFIANPTNRADYLNPKPHPATTPEEAQKTQVRYAIAKILRSLVKYYPPPRNAGGFGTLSP